MNTEARVAKWHVVVPTSEDVDIAALDEVDRTLYWGLAAQHFSIAPRADWSHILEARASYEALEPEAQRGLRAALAPGLRDARVRYDVAERIAVAAKEAKAREHAARRQREEETQRHAEEMAKWKKITDAGEAHIKAKRAYVEADRVREEWRAQERATYATLQALAPGPLPEALHFNALRYPGIVPEGIVATAEEVLALYLKQHQPALS